MKITIHINPENKSCVIDAHEVTIENYALFCKVLCESYVSTANILIQHHKCGDLNCNAVKYHTSILAAIISTRNMLDLEMKK